MHVTGIGNISLDGDGVLIGTGSAEGPVYLTVTRDGRIQYRTADQAVGVYTDGRVVLEGVQEALRANGDGVTFIVGGDDPPTVRPDPLPDQDGR